MKNKVFDIIGLVVEIATFIGILFIAVLALNSCEKNETKIKDLGILKVCGEEIDLNQEYDPVDGISGEYLSEYLNEACNNYYKVER